MGLECVKKELDQIFRRCLKHRRKRIAKKNLTKLQTALWQIAQK